MKKNDLNRALSVLLLLFPVTLGIMALILSGCSVKSPMGRIEFHPSAGIAKYTPGVKTEGPLYSRTGEKLLFENEEIAVTVEEARSAEAGEGSQVFNLLRAHEFVLIKMSISNRSSSKKVRYEPIITALTDSNSGYSKPLDYTRLYEMAMKDAAFDRGLRDFKSSFYDLGVTVMPLQTVSRYLIFRPISKEAKRAELIIKNIYTGTETIDLRFQFELSEVSSGG